MSLNARRWLFVFVSLVVGFVTGLGFKVIYESSTYQPYSWPVNNPPVIANCYGKDFSKLQMVRAIEYWTLRGQIIGMYEHNPPDSVCDKEWLDGFIILRKSERLNDSEKTLASTRRYTSFTTMKGAVIHYKPGTQNLNLINEHELGHALGFAHVEVVGHVMHPIYHKMGRDFWIPAK